MTSVATSANQPPERKLRHTLSKKERLCSKLVLDRLFAEGSSFSRGNIRLIYLVEPGTLFGDNHPLKATFSAPKRRFRRAVDRNHVKRRLREVYRQNKHDLHATLKERNLQMALFVMYSGAKLPSFLGVERDLKRSLAKLKNVICESSTAS